MSQTALILGDEAHYGSYHGSYGLTPVSPTDTAGTHSHFTPHAQAQPHQSTALLRMVKGYHLVTQVASGSPLHSAPLQMSRALPTTAPRRQALTSAWAATLALAPGKDGGEGEAVAASSRHSDDALASKDLLALLQG